MTTLVFGSVMVIAPGIWNHSLVSAQSAINPNLCDELLAGITAEFDPVTHKFKNPKNQPTLDALSERYVRECNDHYRDNYDRKNLATGLRKFIEDRKLSDSAPDILPWFTLHIQEDVLAASELLFNRIISRCPERDRKAIADLKSEIEALKLELASARNDLTRGQRQSAATALEQVKVRTSVLRQEILDLIEEAREPCPTDLSLISGIDEATSFEADKRLCEKIHDEMLALIKSGTNQARLDVLSKEFHEKCPKVLGASYFDDVYKLLSAYVINNIFAVVSPGSSPAAPIAQILPLLMLDTLNEDHRRLSVTLKGLDSKTPKCPGDQELIDKLFAELEAVGYLLDVENITVAQIQEASRRLAVVQAAIEKLKIPCNDRSLGDDTDDEDLAFGDEDPFNVGVLNVQLSEEEIIYIMNLISLGKDKKSTNSTTGASENTKVTPGANTTGKFDDFGTIIEESPNAKITKRWVLLTPMPSYEDDECDYEEDSVLGGAATRPSAGTTPGTFVIDVNGLNFVQKNCPELAAEIARLKAELQGLDSKLSADQLKVMNNSNQISQLEAQQKSLGCPEAPKDKEPDHSEGSPRGVTVTKSYPCSTSKQKIEEKIKELESKIAIAEQNPFAAALQGIGVTDNEIEGYKEQLKLARAVLNSPCEKDPLPRNPNAGPTGTNGIPPPDVNDDVNQDNNGNNNFDDEELDDLGDNDIIL